MSGNHGASNGGLRPAGCLLDSVGCDHRKRGQSHDADDVGQLTVAQATFRSLLSSTHWRVLSQHGLVLTVRVSPFWKLWLTFAGEGLPRYCIEEVPGAADERPWPYSRAWTGRLGPRWDSDLVHVQIRLMQARARRGCTGGYTRLRLVQAAVARCAEPALQPKSGKRGWYGNGCTMRYARCHETDGQRSKEGAPDAGMGGLPRGRERSRLAGGAAAHADAQRQGGDADRGRAAWGLRVVVEQRAAADLVL